MNKRFWVKRIKIFLMDNKILLGVLFFWFFGAFLVYFFSYKLSFDRALQAAFFFNHTEDDFSSAYNIWSEGIVFGIIFTFLFQSIIGRYNPERGCRLMAKEMRNHIVVIGYSHLGERLVNYFREKDISYCLVEKDREKIDELLKAGEPIVVDDAREKDALEDAGVGRAKAVIIATNDLGTALIVTKRVREHNKKCFILARCFEDEFAEVIESLGANEVISSSKNAFDDIVRRLGV